MFRWTEVHDRKFRKRSWPGTEAAANWAEPVKRINSSCFLSGPFSFLLVRQEESLKCFALSENKTESWWCWSLFTMRLSLANFMETLVDRWDHILATQWRRQTSTMTGESKPRVFSLSVSFTLSFSIISCRIYIRCHQQLIQHKSPFLVYRLTDLLVGAPMFMVRGSDSRLEEMGRVYVYLQRSPLNLELRLPHLTGTQVFGRFGSTIAPLGDLNQDGFNGKNGRL